SAPSDAVAWLAKGRVLVFSGKSGEARTAIQTALRLSPRGPLSWVILLTLTIAHYFQRDYRAAVEMAQRTIREHPQFVLPYCWWAADLGQLGEKSASANALRRAIDVSPESFSFYVNGCPPWFRPEDHEHMLDGLRKAGWHG